MDTPRGNTMELKFRRFDLELAHRWAIASILQPQGERGLDVFKVVLLELRDGDGTEGLGESAPSSLYGETVETTMDFLRKVDAGRLSFSDVAGSMDYVDHLAPGDYAAKSALNVALLDGAARRAGQPLHDFLGLGFQENKHVTSFSIGLDKPEIIRAKVAEAAGYPILKLKVGGADDRANLKTLREAAPSKTVRVDANEGWKTKEEALRNLEWLAADGHIEFVEQPMPARTAPAEMAWLKERSPLPLMADESYRSAADLTRCADCFHSVNVKLVKTGGVTAAVEALRAARGVGLKRMLGCMIESSVLISAAAHLAELADYLDLDGNLLTTNDPYRGVTAERGRISFANAPRATGLRVAVAAS